MGRIIPYIMEKIWKKMIETTNQFKSRKVRPT
jgi:hypothetical protein